MSAPDAIPHRPGASLLARLAGRLARGGNRLTVLCYHRVAQPEPDRFQGFRTNISATPADFARQLDALARRCTPVGVGDLHAFLECGRALPPRPALVTFDDGYRDNGAVAWPILRAKGIPATVFLATDHIGTGQPFVWDFAAYCVETTRLGRADLPLLGPRPLRTARERETALLAFVETLKARLDGEKWPLARRLAETLEVDPPRSAFADLYLDWDAVRALAREGLSFGGHTCTHPILTRMADAQAQGEFAGSRARIVAETGRIPVAFAYPNGARADFTPSHEAMARAAGYGLAFTMEPGPVSLAQAARRPTAIGRIYVGRDDGPVRFAAKLVGAARLRAGLRVWRAQAVHTKSA